MAYIVTKEFVEGNLKGIIIEERTTVFFRASNKIYGGGWTGPKYRVLNCRPSLNQA